MADATDVGNAVLFLVSDESHDVTGLDSKLDAGSALELPFGGGTVDVGEQVTLRCLFVKPRDGTTTKRQP